MTEDQDRAFKDLLDGLGKGIGNAVAHEIGHQFKLPDMNCGIGSAPPCPGPPGDLYESAQGATQFGNAGPPLHWTSRDAEELRKKLLKMRNPQ